MGAGKQGRLESTVGPPHEPLGRGGVVILGVILAVAGAIRLVGLADWPPGLHQDEASRAWNSRCLLATGKDHRGQDWPIFYTRVYGANDFTLFQYVLMPFQLIGGMNVWTTRLPGALAGVVSVLLIYMVGSRLFGRATGLVAAGLLAVSPWAVQVGRTGMGVSANSPAALLVMLGLLFAGAPIADGPDRRLCPVAAALAGLVAGIACYGYFAWRIYLPLLMLAVVVATWRDWWQLLRTRKGALVVASFVVAAGVTFGPLAWRHAFDTSAQRVGTSFWVWEKDDGPLTRVAKVTARYPVHFGPDFLFRQGDKLEMLSPPNFRPGGIPVAGGQLYWYMLPLLLGGAGIVLWRVRSSRAARVLLVWVLVYPAADLLWARPLEASRDFWGVHSLRAYPGIDALYLLAAVGAVALGTAIYRRHRKLALALGAAGLAAALALSAWYYPTFFGSFGRRTTIYHDYHVDIRKACEWLKPRLDEYDAVFWTVNSTNQPYTVTLVSLGYDPHQWFRETRVFRDMHFGRDVCYQYGKMHFMYDYDKVTRPMLRAMQGNNKREHVLFIVRPSRMKTDDGKVHEIIRPDGETALLFYERDI